MGRRTSIEAGTRIVVLTLLLTGVAGCYRHTFTIGNGAPMAPVSVEQWRHHWLWGLVSPDRELELQEMCPSGDATIEVQQSFLNGLVASLTGAIYSPTTVRVRCAGGTASLDLDTDDLAKLASDPDFLSWLGDVMPEGLDEVRQARLHSLAQ